MFWGCIFYEKLVYYCQLAEILTLVIIWMYSMQICGHSCANILLENTSFCRVIALYVAQYSGVVRKCELGGGA